MTTTPLEPGFYRHYKGNYYQVLAVVTHSETMEQMVLYRALYGEFGLWVRPLTMFVEAVMVNGEQQARFCYLSKQYPADAPPSPAAACSF